MKYRGKLKNLKMEEQFWMKQEHLILSLGEFLFWRNISNNSFRVLGMPGDQIGGDNLILLNFCLLKLMFTSMLSSMVETYSWSWGFYTTDCMLPQGVWVKMAAPVHTHFLCSGFKALSWSSWGEAYVLSFCRESSGVPLLMSYLFCFILGALYQWEIKRESKIIGISF